MSFTHLNPSLIKKQVSSDFQTAREKGYNVFMTLPFGSINYNLDTKNSDIDTKIIIIPSFKDLLENNKLNQTYEEIKDDGETKREISIVDIRDFFAYLKRNSAYYWEFLCSKYQLINENYCEEYIEIYNLQEDILISNPLGGMTSLHGQFFNYYDDFRRQTRDNFWYNPKKVVGMERIYKQLFYYQEYIYCRINMDKILWRPDEEREELLELLHQLPIQKAQEYVNKLKKKINIIYTEFNKEFNYVNRDSLPVNKKLNDLLEKIIKKHLKEFDNNFKE